MSTGQPRQKFLPTTYNPGDDTTPALFSAENPWNPIISCPADFPIEHFETAISQLVHHPEYNSTLILRSDIVKDLTEDIPSDTPGLHDYIKRRCIHRKLLPRRPGRDEGLEQYCTFYSSKISEAENTPTDTLVLTPIIPPGSKLPYYHPSVYHIAFRYIDSTASPSLRIEVLPLPNTPTDPNSRLYRTCLALLDTLHRYGWGALTNYKKRVAHDCLVSREGYQDLYLLMRERHKHIVSTWQEVTDPLKHVFEDIGIATFLMLYWKNAYQHHHSTENTNNDLDPERPWTNWPRPPGGFCDFGCGNGLLTHILVSEGYDGSGIDVRARQSWAQYPQGTQTRLHVYAFDPTSDELPEFLRPGVFIIGNHADELTPWIPVFATIRKASGYLSIPCCAWTFDAKFERSSTPFLPVSDLTVDNKSSKNHHETGLPLKFIDGLNLGGDGSHTSSYSTYRIWLATLSLHCGWEVECEALRIPSTRNWAIAGRKRLSTMNEEDAIANAQAIVDDIKSRGIFKTRRPEGKAGEH